MKSMRMRWVGYAARMEMIINAFTILVGKPTGRDHFENLCVDGIYNIKMELKGIECEDVDWIHLAQDRYE
jgi:hypothetical protein